MKIDPSDLEIMTTAAGGPGGQLSFGAPHVGSLAQQLGGQAESHILRGQGNRLDVGESLVQRARESAREDLQAAVEMLEDAYGRVQALVDGGLRKQNRVMESYARET